MCHSCYHVASVFKFCPPIFSCSPERDEKYLGFEFPDTIRVNLGSVLNKLGAALLSDRHMLESTKKPEGT